MRKITVAITAAALAVSMLAQAIPAAAVAGYDSSYAGESAFVNLAPGQSNEFQVFFVNNGTTTWSVGTATQVDLAACLEDKVTCNAQDATEAPWNAGWRSATRYATSTQTSVAPGSIATFKYTVTAPAGVAAGTYRFNGDLVLASTGERIRPEGYYQEATVGGAGGAAAITSLTPSSGSSNGGTTVTIAGSAFTCTPAFPTVTFGSTNAAVTSCGASSLTVTSPAGAVGPASVTVTNNGAGPSNSLTYTYLDTTAPTYTSAAVNGSVVTITFSEPVCRTAAWAATDWGVTVNGIEVTFEDTADFIPACDAEFDNGVATSTLLLGATPPPGSFVAVTLNGTGGAVLRDTAGNTTVSPQTRTTTAAPAETTAPTIASISGTQGATTMTITFSEPVYCTAFTFDTTDITITDNNSATTDPTATAAGPNACGASAATADTSFSVTLSAALPANTTYTVTLTPEANEIQDPSGNDLATSSSAQFTTGAADFTPPTITDARLTANVGTTDFTEITDGFSATFSEAMNTTTAGDTITVQDGDGTVVTLTCGTDVSCTWDSGATTITIAVTAPLTVPVAPAPGAGTTPGLQIPFTIVTLSGFADASPSANTPNLPGSADRTVDYE